MNRFKENLRYFRIYKKLTQQELGQIFGVSKMAVSHWEKGNGQPDYDILIKLAEFFETTVDELIGFDEKK